MPFVVEEKRGVHLVRILEPKLTYPLLGPFFAVLKRLVEAGARLVALNLAAVTPGPYTLICLPLRIPGAEGAPARALLKR